MRKKNMLFYLVLFAFVFSGIAIADQVRIFKIKYRPAEELMDVIKVALSKDGAVTLDKRTNSLVVRDKPENIRMVQQLLGQQDVKPVSVNIRVYDVGANELSNIGVKVNWQVQDGAWRVGNLQGRGKGTRFGVSGNQIHHSSSMSSQKWLKVLSGSKATMITGQRMELDAARIDYYQRFGIGVKGVGVRQIQTGFEIRPVVVGDRVRVTITPVVTTYGPGGAKQTRLTDFSVEAEVADGGRLLVGSQDTQGSRFVTEAFSSVSKTTGSSGSYMLLEVDVEN